MGILDLGTTTDSASTILNFSGPDLAAFIGTGTCDVGCTTVSGSTFQGGGANIHNVQNTTAGCFANIEYNFDDLPPAQVSEPAAFALMSLTLASLQKIHSFTGETEANISPHKVTVRRNGFCFYLGDIKFA